MATLSDFNRDGKRYVALNGVGDDQDQSILFDHVSSYDLIRSFVDANCNWSRVLESRKNQWKPSILPEADGLVYNPPGKPEDIRNCTVSAFGNTHKTINNSLSSQKDVDWFYKGNGTTVIGTDHPLISNLNSYGCGIEIEYAAVFMINAAGDPIYIGYTIANDFSDAEMRRRMPSLANLSKLAATSFGRFLFLAPIPTKTEIACTILRDGKPAWRVNGQLGSEAMKYSFSYLNELLFQNQSIKGDAYTIHYMLLGASISSNKAEFDMKHSDIILVHDEDNNVILRNEYIDEAIVCACC
ncbi:hypothetical protein [Agrobacterium vitis]|uniref:Uncharacterized protein n=1 Tax=Agrobacterium vitis TaxID=373 RepID=A0AAE2RGW9_AGRVI|nr:hypothetical protein [Agrobacterium vitis]MBF2717264.1 hypothetical protein [Agrobacterium vitis]